MNNKDLNYLDDKFDSIAKSKLYKQCQACKYWIERNEGCDHMKCICKNEFCYACGKNYVNAAPSCSCNANQQDNYYNY